LVLLQRGRKALDMNFKDKKVIVMGAGKSGIAAMKLLNGAGACPVLFDENKELDINAIKEKLGFDADIVCGELSKEVIEGADLLVMSPGIPVDTEFVNQFRKCNIPVWGEIELAYRAGKGRIVAITGTNGKTTTTALTGKIMADYYGHSYIVGNIGNPYTDIALDTKDSDVVVAEISSFQLETADEFRPQVSSILNITPDHLNRHHTMENYIACKEAVSKNQDKNDTCVLNYEDEVLRTFADKCPARVVFFSSKTVLDDGLYLENDERTLLWQE